MATPQQLFGVVVRGFGLYLLLGGLYNLFTGFYLPLAPAEKGHSAPVTFLAYAVAEILISLYLLRGASRLIRFCYPQADPQPTDTQAEQGAA